MILKGRLVLKHKVVRGSVRLDGQEIREVMEDRCGLALDYGFQFGDASPCHIRVNLATREDNIRDAADALIRVLRR